MATIRFDSNADEIIRLKNEAADRIIEELGQQGERNAKKEVTRAVYDTPESPIYPRTGNLRQHLTHDRDGDTAIIGSPTEYAPYVEFGTRRMSPRPFMKPAVQNHIDEYKKIIEDGLKNA